MDVLRREDVRFAMKQREMYHRNYWRIYYAYKSNLFYNSHALAWAMHRKAFSVIKKTYNVTDREFEILMSLFNIAKAWDADNHVGITTTYNVFFTDMGTINAYRGTILRMAGKNLIQRIVSKKMRLLVREKMKVFRIPGEPVYQITDKSKNIERMYNTEIGKSFGAMVKTNPDIITSAKEMDRMFLNKKLKL